VLDTSAILTFFLQEKGADQVRQLLRAASTGKVRLYYSFVSFMEMYYVIQRQTGAESAKRRCTELKALPMTRVESYEALAIRAAELKAECRISFADAWVGATAQLIQGTLVHKDPELEKLTPPVLTLPLPYQKL